MAEILPGMRESHENPAPQSKLGGMHENPSARLHHMRIKPTASGHTVTHHASTNGEPIATHEFGHDKGPALIAHMAKHAGIHMGEGPETADSSDMMQG